MISLKESLFQIAKHFYVNAYAVGYRTNKNSDDFSYEKSKTYNVILPTKHEWYADPFPFIYKDKKYIFVEIMSDKNNGIGKIGVCCVDDKTPSIKCIIDEPFHMSYPNVFQLNNEIYMIPETFQAKQIRLYKAVSFPDKWEFETVLFDGAAYTDTSLFFAENNCFAISWDVEKEKLFLFEFDTKAKKFIPIDDSNSTYIDKRPGGNFINYKNGCVYHALQNADNSYGNYLHIAKVDSFDKNGLVENEIATYKVDNISTNVRNNFNRNHTFNRVCDFEVVDLQYKQLNLFNKMKDCS